MSGNGLHNLGVLRVEVPEQAKPRTEAEILADFYNKVCDRAERNMAHTGTVSGAHWNAMKQVLAEMGVEVTR